MKNNLQFEVKFHSSDVEHTFPATALFKDVVDYLKQISGGQKVTFTYAKKGFNVLFDGEHVGTIKPTYLKLAKVVHLHNLLVKGGTNK